MTSLAKLKTVRGAKDTTYYMIALSPRGTPYVFDTVRVKREGLSKKAFRQACQEGRKQILLNR